MKREGFAKFFVEESKRAAMPKSFQPAPTDAGSVFVPRNVDWRDPVQFEVYEENLLSEIDGLT